MAARSPASSPPSLAVVTSRVDRRVGDLLEAELTRWQQLDVELGAPLHALQRLIEAGGKRLRPAFCYWAFVGAGGDPEDPRVIEAGAAFELLHAFALVHDDVMDGSSVRRGLPTAHVEFGRRHREGGWRGEDRRFGEAVATLVGDLAHVYADLLIDGASSGPARAQVTSVWHELRLELNVGQYLDLLGAARADRDPGTARRISRYKSGKYTIERPLHLGAALAGCLDAQRAALSELGDPLGEAFQLRDDVLGAFGDAAEVGKPIGQDLREGKPTPLLATAHERASVGQRRLLDRVGMPGLTAAEVAAIQEVLVATGARDEIEDRIGALTERALAALDGAALAGGARSALAELAEFVANRTT